MHINRLIIMAETPKIITRSLKKGKDSTVPGAPATAL
jgi:hypothetical protein